MTNIDLNLIKVFYIVAKENSITKASEILFISQPAVSQSIKKLEQELGGTLFYRSNKGIKLTEEGKIFFVPTAPTTIFIPVISTGKYSAKYFCAFA